MPPSISRAAIPYGLLALIAVGGGCQRGSMWNLVAVEGTVTKGGRPLHNIEVIFFAESDAGTRGPRASGTTDEAGHYRLRTDNGDDGAVVGKHRIVLRDLNAAKGQLERPLRGPRPPETAKRLGQQKPPAAAVRVPPSYQHFTKTPLRAEVGSQPLTFDILIP